ITIEDPIEYELKGISQTQVEKSRGYTFATGLRAIVRQDPDIILVGEVRDDETADIAINSSLTGHLVLSTLHTNSATATIPRLIEMGVKPSLIPSSMNAIIGQRLVRKLCSHCKEEYAPAEESIESIKKIISIISPKAKLDVPSKVEKLYRPKGCPKCNNLGYKGRVGIFEVFTMNPEIEKLIQEMAGKTELAVAALESGMVTMLQDGILKAIEGITTVEEVQRVTGQGEFLEEIYEQLMNQIFARKILISGDVLEKVRETSKNFQEFQKLLDASPKNEVNKLIFSLAVILGASDIHLEPGEDKVLVRFRLDGILEKVGEIQINDYPNLLGEIKILGGLKAEVRQGIVDSRFSINFEDKADLLSEKSIDIRLSIILGGFGETAVMRLLNKGAVALELDNLGLRKENLEKIQEAVKKPSGIFLNTGPTGSGKTTTLYSILSYLNKPGVKVITVEDPIEYQLPGILQTSVSDKDGYTFASALRSLLRQNPDIMMIGEIRDEETAGIAVQASLTGHLVLSTLHTNNASSSIQRMLNMNISPDDIAVSVNAFMAQRLVRKLCECKEKYALSPEERALIQKVVSEISPETKVPIPETEFAFRPKGCPKCNNLGFSGRTTISEILLIDKTIEALINEKASLSKIQETAQASGMLTMLQDGILKVLEGETSLSEIERVTEV
ncbi:MAG: GspE/PulE family protein, partial [Patescibacteria group bacterium]